jgi:Xaa-Pro aminopeptidase
MAVGKDSANYRKRVERCQGLMREREIDALFLALGPNMYYLSGFLEEPGERLLTLIIPQSGNPLFLVPEMYEEHVRTFSWIDNLVPWKESQDPKTVLSTVMKETIPKHSRIGVDGRMWSRFLLMLQAVAPDADYKDADPVVSNLRIRKSREEIALLEKAAEIADATLKEATNECKPGVPEGQVAAKIVYELRRRGADGVAFEPVASSGPNAALPHYRSGERKLQNGDLVVLDFGCTYHGYHSDITRTVALGHCDAEREKVYSIVQSAQERACKEGVEGMEAQQLDGIARRVIEGAGYGGFFIHRTGHGIGLEVHEEPYIVDGNAAKLADGMAFSVEPGIYIPGKFGVRIEDIVVVDSGRLRRLNKCTRDLMIV